MSKSFNIGQVIQFRGMELLAIASGFALLDENRNFKHGTTIEALPCLKKVKHFIQLVHENESFLVFEEGVSIESLLHETMQTMLDKTVASVK